MRIRTVKPEFWVSESIGRLSREARLLFIGLWSFADDSGRSRGAFPAISGALFPYDDDAIQLIPGWFAELEREGMVFRYKAEDGNTYYQLPNWLKHQKIEKPSASKFPAFTESSPNIHRILPEGYPLDQGSGIRDQGPMEQGSGDARGGADAPALATEKLKRDKFEKPTLEEMIQHGTEIGLPKEESEACWSHYESNGWMVGRNKMKNWKASMVSWRRRWSANGAQSLFNSSGHTNTANGRGGAVKAQGEISASMQAVLLTKQLDEVSNKMTVIKDTYSGLQSWSESDKEKYNALLARKKELKAKLGIQV